MVWLDDPEGLFNPKWFPDSMISSAESNTATIQKGRLVVALYLCAGENQNKQTNIQETFSEIWPSTRLHLELQADSAFSLQHFPYIYIYH